MPPPNRRRSASPPRMPRSKATPSKGAAKQKTTSPPPRKRPKPDIIVDTVPNFDINDVGPHPGFIEPCQRYVFEQRISRDLRLLGTEGAKEDNFRIQGVLFIDQVRKSLGLPTKTLNTASVIFHRFRLRNSLESGQYTLSDAAASALYLASKIEDTAKRPNQIICAAFNLNLPLVEQRQPDDDFFDPLSDRLVDLERLMLESITFEFDTRHPQQALMNVLQLEFGLSLGDPADKKIIYTAWEIGMDLNLTFALLKQSAATMAIACAELAMRLRGRASDVEALFPTFANAIEEDGANVADAPYTRFDTTRSAVLETEMDVLDLYTTHRSSTFAGAKFPLDEIMQVRIALNQIAERFAIPRHVNCRSSSTNGDAPALHLQSPQYVRDLKLETEQPANGAAGTDGTAADEKDPGLQIIAVKRFVLKPAHAVQELQSLDRYYLTREEEYEREHEVSDGWETAPEDGGDGDVKLEDVESSGRGRADGNGSSRKEDPSGSFRRKKR